MLIRNKKECLICGNPKILKYLDLGHSALANSFLSKKDLSKKEMQFPLRVAYCPKCHLSQLMDIIDRKKIFEHYAYFSSTSPQLEQYFQNYAEDLKKKFPNQAKQLVVEIGSNDGILLKYFKKMKLPVLGVDPAKNIARKANHNKIRTLPLFFNSRNSEKIKKAYGDAGIIIANNVLAHTDSPLQVISGVKNLLDKKGVFVFEVQYLKDLLDKNEFDNTYHEHTCYFSMAPLCTLLEKYGLEVFDLKHTSAQGGSIRVFAGHKNINKKNFKLKTLLEEERVAGLYKKQTYLNFAKKPKIIKKELLDALRKIKKTGKKIVGYGASAKGNTLLQYCGIKSEIDYIVDTAPFKQNKFTPGTHIPIRDPKYLKKDPPDYVLILAWNYADSIMKKESWLKGKGGKFIIPIPKVKII